jgi:hypothetical protein
MEHLLSLVREFISMNLFRRSHILGEVGLLAKPFECGLIMPMAQWNLRGLLKQEQKLLHFSPEGFGCPVSAVAHLYSYNGLTG